MRDVGHMEATDFIYSAASVCALSYAEAVAIYLRARGLLDDGVTHLGAPIPADWEPDPLGRLYDRIEASFEGDGLSLQGGRIHIVNGSFA